MINKSGREKGYLSGLGVLQHTSKNHYCLFLQLPWSKLRQTDSRGAPSILSEPENPDGGGVSHGAPASRGSPLQTPVRMQPQRKHQDHVLITSTDFSDRNLWNFSVFFVRKRSWFDKQPKKSNMFSFVFCFSLQISDTKERVWGRVVSLILDRLESRVVFLSDAESDMHVLLLRTEYSARTVLACI